MNTAVVTRGKLVIGRRRLGGLIVGVAAVSAAVSGVLVGIAVNDASSRSDAAPDTSASESEQVSLTDAWRARSGEFVEWAQGASPEELAGAFNYTSYAVSPYTP